MGIIRSNTMVAASRGKSSCVTYALPVGRVSGPGDFRLRPYGARVSQERFRARLRGDADMRACKRKWKNYNFQAEEKSGEKTGAARASHAPAAFSVSRIAPVDALDVVCAMTVSLRRRKWRRSAKKIGSRRHSTRAHSSFLSSALIAGAKPRDDLKI